MIHAAALAILLAQQPLSPADAGTYNGNQTNLTQASPENCPLDEMGKPACRETDDDFDDWQG